MDAFFKLPPVTRTFVVIAVVVSVAVSKGLVGVDPIAFIPGKVIPQAWRVFTNYFLIGAPTLKLLNIIFDAYFFYMNSVRCESNFASPADYTIFIGFTTTLITLMSLVVFPGYFFADRLLLALAYYSCMKANPGERAGLYFVQVPIRVYPFCLMAMAYLRYESLDAALAEGTGILAAHAYLFLTDILPLWRGKPTTWFNAPTWFERCFEHPFFGNVVPGSAGAQQPHFDPEIRRGGGPKFEGASGSSAWRQRGKGRKLGTD